MEMTTVTIRCLHSLSQVLVFMFVSLGCCSFGFSMRQPIFGLNTSTMEKVIRSNYTQREISTEDVLMTIKALRRTTDESIMFLFGQDYNDLMNEMPTFLSKDIIDAMYLRNDGDVEELSKSFSYMEKNNTLLLVDRPTNIVDLFLKMRMKRVKTHLVKWILFMEGKDAVDSKAKLEEFVNEGTKVILFIKSSEGHLDLYLPSVDTYGITRFKTKTKAESRRDFEDTVLVKPQHPYSLRGRQLKVAIKEILMVVETGRSFPDGSVELVSGIEVNLLRIIGSALNFTFKAYTSVDNTFGDLTQDDNVTGIIGMVARREVSFAMAGLSITETRASVVDFTAIYGSGRLLLMSLAPEERNKFLAVLSPFKLQVWICLAIAVLLMGYIVVFISRFDHIYESSKAKTDVQCVMFSMFRIVVNQGSEMKEESPHVRAVLSFWYFFCVIVSALYSGMLTAVLAIPAYDTPIDSLHDLPRAVKDGFSVGTLGGSNYELYFKYATEGVLKQTWDLFNHEDRSESFVGNVLAGIHRVLKGKYVFITGDHFGYVAGRMYGEKTFHLSKERFAPTFAAIACQVGSPVQNTLSQVLLRLDETGVRRKQANDVRLTLPVFSSALETEQRNFAFTINHLQVGSR